MKNWFKIGSFFILLILLTAEDCSETSREDTYEDRQTKMFNGIENEFEKEQLRQEDLKGFELRALQMFTELIDYINISADTSLSEEFRIQSIEMLSDLFVSEDEFQSFLNEFNLSENEQKTIIYMNGINPVHFDIISYTISDKFKKQSDLTYSGTIKFELSSNRGQTIPEEKLLGIRLQQSRKQFGENVEKVWEVFLGTIK